MPLAPPARRLGLALALLSCAPALAAGQGGSIGQLPGPAAFDGRCPPARTLRLRAAADALRKHWPQGEALEFATVAGLPLADAPSALAALRTALSPKPPPTWSAARGCRTVLCAVRQALGDEEAGLWWLAVSLASAPASLDQSRWGGRIGLWKAGELRAIYRAVALLGPPHARPSNLKSYRRLPDGYQPAWGYNALSTRGDPELGGGGAIELRDTVWKLAPRVQVAVLAHELGHQIDYSWAEAAGQGALLSEGSAWRATYPPGTRFDAASAPAPGADPQLAAPAVTGEDFPNGVDTALLAPSTFQADEPKKAAFVRKLLGRPPPELPGLAELAGGPPLDRALQPLGGAFAAVRDCLSWVQRATRTSGPYTYWWWLRWLPDSSAFGTSGSTSHLAATSCLDEALRRLASTPAWTELSCGVDPEELELAASSRLEQEVAQFVRAAREVESASPAASRAACVQRGQLTVDCLAGPSGLAAARAGAARLARRRTEAEGRPGPADELDILRDLLLRLAPLAPSDEALAARWPLLRDGKEAMGICLQDLGSVSAAADAPGVWWVWTTDHETGQVQGFHDVFAHRPCHQALTAELSRQGLQIEPEGPLLQHFYYLLDRETGAARAAFHEQVERGWPEVRALCHLTGGDRAALPEQQPCVAAWLRKRLAPVVSPGRLDAAARHLAAVFHGPP